MSWSCCKGEYTKNRPGIGGIENRKKTERVLRLIVGMELPTDELLVRQSG